MATPATVQQRFAEALQLHQSGRLPEAVQAYQRVLKAAPEHVDALQLLGVARSQQGDHAEAVKLIRRALAIAPDYPQAHCNLGLSLKALGRLEDASRHFEKAARLAPGLAEAHNGLGSALQALGRLDEAIRSYQQALAVAPRLVAARYNLGTAYSALGRHEDAAVQYRQALELNPRHVEALNNLGLALRELERLDDAERCFNDALALEPRHLPALRNLGALLLDRGRSAQAVECYERVLALDSGDLASRLQLAAALSRLGRTDDALRLCEEALAADPRSADARFTIGSVLRASHRYDEALVQFEAVLALDPDYAPVQYELGTVANALGRREEAIAQFERALEMDPGLVRVHVDLGISLIAAGRLAEGWAHYGLRRKRGRFGGLPEWDGDYAVLGPDHPLTLIGEQGVGDQVFYSLALERLPAELGGVRVVLDRRLHPLYARRFPRIEWIDPAEFVAHPERFARGCWKGLVEFAASQWQSPEACRRTAPLLAADREHPAFRLPPRGRPVYGIGWQSKAADGVFKVVDPVQIVRGIPDYRDATLLDLQYNDEPQTRERVRRELGVELIRFEGVDYFNDFEAVAALLAACDRFVSVTNTTVHLAGALGVPTVVFVPRLPQFIYWAYGDERVPWYPSIRVVRQGAPGDWSDVTERLQAVLA